MPVPAGAMTLTRYGRRSVNARRATSSSWARSASRPTIGVRGALQLGTAGDRASGQGRSLALQLELLERAERVRAGGGARGAGADEDLPRLGGLLEPAATFTASPVTMKSARTSSRLATTSPVLIPIRIGSRSPSAGSLAHGDRAAPARRRRARRASSSWATGQPEDRHRRVADELLERAGVACHDLRARS